TVEQLSEEFSSNEVRAEKVYGGKEVSVVGYVARVQKNRGEDGAQVKDEEYYVVWISSAPGDPRLPPGASLARPLARIKCLFARTEADTLAKLLPRQEVVIRGSCHPVSVQVGPAGREVERTEVEMRGCKVVSVK
ncbi:MAG: OB-fold putative lipoprotein, partial [Gemmatales bacterium]|nr:OB-fold putative lipoprotein [Gemmatales bacterium]MDW8388025.1 hypothetical protein [Gemmatales bacterium]